MTTTTTPASATPPSTPPTTHTPAASTATAQTTTVEAATVEATTGPTLADQAPILLGHVAGYVGHRTIAIGLQHGLVQALADQPGSTADQLADHLDLDATYTAVWCRGAVASSIVDRDGDGYRLAPHMDTLLLDEDSPALVGGVFRVFSAPEMFDLFSGRLVSGERIWWNDTSDEWIAGVAGTGRPFYTRLVPDGLARVPGLADRLAAGARVIDTSCGTGAGVVRLATTYPDALVLGVDGDQRSVELARERAEAAGVADRVTFVASPLEDFVADEPADLVINNISMHECRDIDTATRRVRDALRPGGVFVISDFPFPASDDGLRTVPGRIMSGIQYFEAQIDDQLLAREVYDDLLDRHDFVELGSASLTPLHALTWGFVPADR